MSPQKQHPIEEEERPTPSQQFVVSSLQHLNAASIDLFVCRVNTWETTMKDEADNYLTVGEVLMRLKARVVQALGLPDKSARADKK